MGAGRVALVPLGGKLRRHSKKSVDSDNMVSGGDFRTSVSYEESRLSVLLQFVGVSERLYYVQFAVKKITFARTGLCVVGRVDMLMRID